MTPLVPCLLQRKIVPKVWGGCALSRQFDFDLPLDRRTGETWEVYDRPGESIPLRDGTGTLAELMAHDREGLLGRGVATAAGGRFPLAVKFVDAAQELSVQVHPGDEQAAAEGDSGKAEAWVVVSVGERACVRRGFRAGVTPEQFAATASTAEVLDLLETFSPAAGDSVHLPAGTVHALGPDVLVYEVQQNSDITYRLYDWGRPRETHLEQGLRAARFDRAPETTTTPESIGRGAEWLVKDEHFRLRRFPVDTPCTLGTEGSFKLMTVLRGRGTLGWRSAGRDEPLAFAAGDTILVPAAIGSVFMSPVGEVELLLVDPGEGS